MHWPYLGSYVVIGVVVWRSVITLVAAESFRSLWRVASCGGVRVVAFCFLGLVVSDLG